MIDEGTGPPVVLCHSLASSTSDLQPLADELLARGWRVVRFDQRGHGESSGPGDVSVRRLACDVEELITRLGLRDAVLVGHSSGGYALLAMDPGFVLEHVRGIVCVGTTPALTRATERLMMRYAGSRWAASLQATRLVGVAMVRLGAFGRRPPRHLVEQVWRTAAACRPETRKAYAKAMLRTADLAAAAAGLGVPVVSVRGTRDRVVSGRRARELAARAHQGSLVEVPGAGHMLVVERPTAIAEAVDRLR